MKPRYKSHIKDAARPVPVLTKVECVLKSAINNGHYRFATDNAGALYWQNHSPAYPIWYVIAYRVLDHSLIPKTKR